MPTFKFDDEHGGTIEVSVKTTHHDAGEYISPHLEPIQRALGLDPSGVTRECVLLSDIYSQIRQYRRLLGKCAASLTAHNNADSQHFTPLADIDELSRLATETTTRPFGWTPEGVPCKRPLPSADAAPPVNEWQPVIDMLNFAGGPGVVHHPDEVCEYLRTWQHLTSRAAASLEQHNVDREYATPDADIADLKKFVQPIDTRAPYPLTYNTPFGQLATFGGPSEDPVSTTLPRKPARASTFGADGPRVHADHALEYTSEEVAAHLKRLWGALGCTDTRGGAWADALGVVKYLAAQEVAHLHAATHASMQLSQLWEALGRGEGTRGDWGAALAAVRVLVSHAPEAARVSDHCWTKLDYELQRIAKASEDELDAIGRVLGRARANIGRPPSYIETVDEYRAELTRLTNVKYA